MLANTLADSLTSHRFSDKRRLQGVVAAGAGGRPGGGGSAAWDPASRRCRQGGFAEGAEYGRWVVKAVVKAAPLPPPSSTGGRERPRRIRPSTGNEAVKVGAALSLGKSA